MVTSNHAVVFAPAVVSLRDATLVGGRIHLFVPIADEAGQAEIEGREAGGTGTEVDRS